jgi:hypothetical protein
MIAALTGSLRLCEAGHRPDQFAKGTESLSNGENRRIYREQRPSSTISGSLSCPNSAANRGFLHFSCVRYLVVCKYVARNSARASPPCPPVEAIAEIVQARPDEWRTSVIVRPQLLWFILVVFLLAAQACAVAAQKEAFSGSSSRTAPGSDVTGLWEGTVVNGCGFVQMERTRCHAVVNIALTMTQQGSTVRGSYRCSIGTMMCRKLNDTGEIA